MPANIPWRGVNILAFYPAWETNTSTERANQGRGQQFVFRRQRGPTMIRDHRDDKHGALRQLGTDLEAQGVQREATASLSLSQSHMGVTITGWMITQRWETDSLVFM